MASAKRLSAFDLDALREAFKKSVREQNVRAADWAEYAKQFLAQLPHGVPGEEKRITRR